MPISMLVDPEHETGVVHRQTSEYYDILGDNIYYPINHVQLRDLLGKLLTQLDAMALPDRAHKAAKTLLVQEIWRWWDGVAVNSTTSYKGCIAPIVARNGGKVPKGCQGDDGVVYEEAPSNRWGFESEEQWLSGNVAQSEPTP